MKSAIQLDGVFFVVNINSNVSSSDCNVCANKNYNCIENRMGLEQNIKNLLNSSPGFCVIKPT